MAQSTYEYVPVLLMIVGRECAMTILAEAKLSGTLTLSAVENTYVLVRSKHITRYVSTACIRGVGKYDITIKINSSKHLFFLLRPQ